MRTAKKDDIEQAAIRLFALKGPAGTTIKDIAAQSGVTEGALYRHYSGKDAMAAALFARELAHIRAALLEHIEGDADPAPKLRGIAECLYGLYAERPYSVLFVLLNFQNLQSIDLPGETGNIYDFIRERTEQILSGLPGDYSPVTPALLAGLLIEPVLFHHYGKLPEPPATYARNVAAVCCRLLGVAYDF